MQNPSSNDRADEPRSAASAPEGVARNFDIDASQAVVFAKAAASIIALIDTTTPLIDPSRVAQLDEEISGRDWANVDDEINGALRLMTEARRRFGELVRVLQAQSLLLEAAGVGVWRYDPRSREIDWSAGGRAMLAGSGADICSADDFTAACHPEDRDHLVELLGRAADGESGALDHRIRDGNGRWNWARMHVSGERVAGRPHVVHGITQDVTELSEAITAATEAHREADANAQRLKIALSAAKAAVVEVDFSSRSVWLSPQFVEIIGRSMSYEESKRTVWPFVFQDDAPTIELAVEGWLRGEMIEPLCARIVRPDGSLCWVDIYTEIQKDPNGRWLRGISLLMDVDERKRQKLALIEAERAATISTEAKSRFLANMSHEIRTPMNGVLGVLQILRRRDLPASDVEMLDEALACGEMLQALLDDVVDLSRIEAGQLELHNEPVDPGALLRGVASMFHLQAQSKGLTVAIKADGLPDLVMVDPVRLRQCLFNLVGNAVKFTLQGSITLRASIVAGAECDRLRFEVEDTGIGIAAEAQDTVFERFQQADISTTRRFGGAGLGLAMVRELALMMAGEVGFVSTDGHGSTFWLEVPAPTADVTLAAWGEMVSPLEGTHILVVEDNSTNRLIATKLLESLGASVQTAEDGERGVEAAKRYAFDLILMDIQMPGIDGVEATRRIRASAGPMARTPVIALTANVLPHQREAYFAAGMNGAIGKPISPEFLLLEIARVIQSGSDQYDAMQRPPPSSSDVGDEA